MTMAQAPCGRARPRSSAGTELRIRRKRAPSEQLTELVHSAARFAMTKLPRGRRRGPIRAAATIAGCGELVQEFDSWPRGRAPAQPVRVRGGAVRRPRPTLAHHRGRCRPIHSHPRTAARSSDRVTARSADPGWHASPCTTPHRVRRRGDSHGSRRWRTSSCPPRMWARRAIPFPRHRARPDRGGADVRAGCESQLRSPHVRIRP